MYVYDVLFLNQNYFFKPVCTKRKRSEPILQHFSAGVPAVPPLWQPHRVGPIPDPPPRFLRPVLRLLRLLALHAGAHALHAGYVCTTRKTPISLVKSCLDFLSLFKQKINETLQWKKKSLYKYEKYLF